MLALIEAIGDSRPRQRDKEGGNMGLLPFTNPHELRRVLVDIKFSSIDSYWNSERVNDRNQISKISPAQNDTFMVKHW